MPAQSPINSIGNSSVRVTVKLNDTLLNDKYDIISINVIHAINKISSAEICLSGGIKSSNEDIPFSEESDFEPGNTVEITAGYGNAGETSIFKGVVIKHKVEIDVTEGYTFKLSCKHKAVELTFNRKEELFKDQTDSDIIKSIIGNYSISCSVDDTSISHEMLFQKLATDWDFILSRSEFNGFIIHIEGDEIKIGKPNFSSEAVLRIALGDSIVLFDGEVNVENQPASVSASGWDSKTQALLQASSAEPALNKQGDLTAEDLSSKLSQKKLSVNAAAPLTSEELQVWANSTLLRLRLNAIKGSVKFVGNPVVKPSDIITLAGVGKKFNGDAFVTEVNNVIDETSWYTTLKFGLDNYPVYRKSDFSYSPASGQLPAVQGLQIATVKQLIEDPLSQYRVLVSFATSATSTDGIWARMATFYASADEGAAFYPEVGDEVIVGFLENDPRYPIILGAVYGPAKKSPAFPVDNNNYIKSITTKTKLKLLFDDEKKIVKIETPGGNKITLSDDAKSIELADMNSNTITMNSDGIKLNSNKDIVVTATGKIALTATGKISVDATQDLELSGSNVSATAQIGLTVKGTASAELSASGQTTVKGGIVMIN